MIEAISVNIKKLKPIYNPCKTDFIPCEEIFPQWLTAKPILEDWHSKIDPIECFFNYNRNGNIGFILPVVLNIVSGKWVNQVEIFPEEDRPKVYEILFSVAGDYIPDKEILESFLRQLITEHTKHQIGQTIKDKEQCIISAGGRTALNELSFRLGL